MDKAHRVVLPPESTPMGIHRVIQVLIGMGLAVTTEKDGETVILNLCQDGQPAGLGEKQKAQIIAMPGSPRVEEI